MAYGEDNEKYYDEVILPKMREVARLCGEKEIPFFSTFTFRPGGNACVHIPNPDDDLDAVNMHIKLESALQGRDLTSMKGVRAAGGTVTVLPRNRLTPEVT